MAAKFSLTPSPTFKAPVEIPTHDGQVSKPVFTFKHRSRSEMDAMTANKEITDSDLVLELCAGWDIEAEFNKENVNLLCQNYIMAPRLIYSAYLTAMYEGAKGN